MSKPRVVLTAGFNRARNVLAIAELLRRREVSVEGILVVSPYSWQRLRTFVQREGMKAVWEAIPRLLGWEASSTSEENLDPLSQLYEEQDIERQPLSRWARQYGISVKRVASLNNQSAINFVDSKGPDWTIYGGGGILRDSFINAADGRILNAHWGPLPEVRGMNACEWSLLLGYKPTLTIHLINRGIDTGGVISEHHIPVGEGDTIEHLRKRCAAIGVKALCETVLDPPDSLPDPRSDAAVHRQCYVLAPALREILAKRLEQGQYL